MVVSVALSAFALGVSDSGATLVPMPLIGGAFFQSDTCWQQRARDCERAETLQA